jgi:hypothetical protein
MRWSLWRSSIVRWSIESTRGGTAWRVGPNAYRTGKSAVRYPLVEQFLCLACSKIELDERTGSLHLCDFDELSGIEAQRLCGRLMHTSGDNIGHHRDCLPYGPAAGRLSDAMLLQNVEQTSEEILRLPEPKDALAACHRQSLIRASALSQPSEACGRLMRSSS